MKRILIAAIVASLALVGAVFAQSTNRSTVVWISIDGFRHDYLKRIAPPTLWRLAHEGAFTTQERPIFPSLTFPNHVAQVTGTTADKSGIPMNTFFDPAVAKVFNLPDEASELLAEPIWVTAKRQGLRVAVVDWPMSHAQTGQWKSDYYEQAFDTKQTDQSRLEHVANLLQTDAQAAKQPLRLIITYMSHVDTVGHRSGPDSLELEQTVRDTDATIDRFLKAVITWFDQSHRDDPNAKLYVLITTDHGMEPVHTLVNLDRLLGADLVAGAKLITSGPVACVYLNDAAEADRPARADAVVERLRSHDYLRAWKAADVPAELHLANERSAPRIGQVVVLLKPGYTFTSQKRATTLPATSSPRGMHGYDPAECPNMLGTAIVWRYRHPLGGIDLGPVDNTQWHATVAHLLGIEPSKDADQRFIDLARN